MTLKQDRAAILRGMRAATKLHRDLATADRLGAGTRIDVFDALMRSQAYLMFKPLKGLLGAYQKFDGVHGVIITTERPLGVQRFTAAHELGHLVMEHEPHADGDEILKRTPQPSAKVEPRQEREADAFASYFLLPPWLLQKLATEQRWSATTQLDADLVYQASLRLGASYKATVHAMRRDDMMRPSDASALGRKAPRDIKAALVEGEGPDTWAGNDVWVLTERDEGAVIYASREDQFLLRLPEHQASGYLWTFDELEDAGLVVLRDTTQSYPETEIGGVVTRSVLMRADQMNPGRYLAHEVRPWNPDDDPQSFSLELQHALETEDGLYAPQIQQIMAQAG